MNDKEQIQDALNAFLATRQIQLFKAVNAQTQSALKAFLALEEIEKLKIADLAFATICTQIENTGTIIKMLETDEKIKRDCAIISFYLLLWYLNQYQSGTLKAAAAAKGYLRTGQYAA